MSCCIHNCVYHDKFTDLQNDSVAPSRAPERGTCSSMLAGCLEHLVQQRSPDHAGLALLFQLGRKPRQGLDMAMLLEAILGHLQVLLHGGEALLGRLDCEGRHILEV